MLTTKLNKILNENLIRSLIVTIKRIEFHFL